MQSKILLATQISYCLILTRFCAGLSRKPLLSPRQYKSNFVLSNADNFLLKAYGMNQWDAENGVWMGDMATSDDVLPTPLYMFGYGSLLWRPGDLLCDFPSHSCICSGWQRIFAQRSSDHRGSPEFPGFVATLVEASYLDSVSRVLTTRKTLEEVKCSGLVWLIPDDRVKATIAELDYRERGGYHRHVINVTLNEDTAYHPAGAVVNALVYSGSISNPNFHFIPDGTELRSIQTVRNSVLVRATDTAAAETGTGAGTEFIDDTESLTVLETQTFSPRSATADIIAAAVGPSGPNSEYLFNLNDFILANGLEDEYIQTLARNVALRLGPWRSPVSRRFKQDTAEGAADSASAIIVSDPTAASEELSQSDAHHRHLEAFLRCKMLLGWGSNEHRQLGMSTAVTHPDSELQATCAPVSLEGVSSRGEFPQSGPTSKLPAEMSEETSSSSTSISAPDFDSVLAVGPQRGNASRRGMVAGEIQHSQVLCGVGYSAFLGPTRVLSLWGKSAEEYVLASVIPAAVGTGTAAEAEGGVLRSAKVSRAPGENERTPTGPGPVDPGSLTSQSREGEVIAISDVVGAALGYEHMLLLSSSGWVVAVGDNYWGQCLGPESFLRVGSQGLKSRLRRLDSTSNEGSYTANMPPAADADSNQTDNNDSGPTVKVLKLAAGVRHSAAVTVDGFLHVWGTGSAAHIALESDFSVHEPSAANGESSKAVGAESNGSVVIKAGSARTVEQGRRPSVSDTAARQPSNGTAVSATAEAKSSAAMGTAAHAGSASTQVNEPWCPLDAKLIDVSCGLHHTVAVDERGRVWSFGDDKFGSLGRAVPGSTGAGRAQTKDSTPRLVDGLERGVRWQRVCCGWSHTVLRGVRPDGSIACAAWGRRDLGQYPLEDNRAVDSAGVPRKNGATGGDSLGESGLRGPPGTQGAEHRAPQMLSLPHGLRIREVWAGSEFTVAADEKGDLWACGWNEHGNLGRGGLLAFESSARWVKVVTSTHRGTAAGADERIEREPEVMGSSRSQGTGPGSAVTHEQHVRLSTVWEGALACGGGHVLCLTHAILDRDT